MSPNQVFPFFLTLFLFACSTPNEPADDFNGAMSSKWNDENLREIHELKNNRNTAGLIEFLKHDEIRYRAEAAMALGSVQDSTALPSLSEVTQDNEPEVRMMAAFALGQLKSSAAAETLIELVRTDTTTAIRTEALEAIGKCNARVAADFLKNYTPHFLFDESGQAWGIYHMALNKRVDKDHARVMIAGLYSEYEEIRLAATHFFGRYHEVVDDVGLEQLLQLAAGDRSAEVRMAAADALGFHEIDGREEVLSELVIYDQHPGVRVNAIRALTKMEAGSTMVTEALFDGNPNVSTAAAQFFVQYPQLADAERLRQQIVAHPVSKVRGLLFSAALQQTNDHQPLLEEFERTLSQTSPEDLVPMVEALVWAPDATNLLDSLTFSETPELSTVAFIALWEQYEKGNRTCDEWDQLVNRILARADYGQLAVLGNKLRNDNFIAQKCMVDISFEPTMSAIELPGGLEAWIELNHARTLLTGKTLLPQPEMNYYNINWELLREAGSQPEIVVHTVRGSFVMVLLAEDAPATVSHLLELIDDGLFENKSFHRVVPNFVIQTGCPRGDGYGSGNVLLRSEFSPLHYGPGVAGMASAGKDTESTQWFVTHRTTPHLDGRYTIFGAVIEGMDVVWELTPGDKIESIERRKVSSKN